ncbi:PREDICTED: rho GTPase-activating protein 27 [Myotis brandtii]|uniref:rho GTPase-activating protein 27 n=1 Tax=Myotis brandtii TaxID=109478 RepID=UPI0007046BB1|nr:PREDICTED: rho GTPase-activating protein 27 [Myotis brandtii]
MAADVEGDVYVLVEHPFQYTGKDGCQVAIQPNERYRLLRRSTEHWWHVDSENTYETIEDVRGPPREECPEQSLRSGTFAPPSPGSLQWQWQPASCSTSAALTGNGLEAQPPTISRPLLVSLLPCASPGLCPVAPPPKLPRAPSQQLSGDRMVDVIAKLTRRPSRALRVQVDETPEPVYANIERQPPATSPVATAGPRPSQVWETHTDTDTGRPYYYNPDTGVTTWDSPFEAAEDATSPAHSLSSVGSHESLETEWGQYWDEESRRVFFYNPVTGDKVWEEEAQEPEEEEEDTDDNDNTLKMQPGLSPGSPKDQRPPTPETDYPEVLTSYPEEDYCSSGSCSEPGPASPFVTPPGWSCHVDPEGQTLYTNQFTQEQWVKLEDQHGKPYFYNPKDSSVRWDLPQIPIPAPRSILKSSQDSETPAQASPPEEKIKTLDKAGVLHRTKTVDKGKRVRKKHWSTSWTVLEGGILTFFKDSKTSAAVGLRQPPKLSTPEYTVDLKGASLAWAPKDKSSKKNVLELRSHDGSEYLIQHDSEAIISTWHKAIAQGIQELSADLPPEEESENSSVDFGSRERLGSWREDEARPGAAAPVLSPGVQESDLSKVRQKLLKFLLKRPTLQSLREKGYIKDQVFGCALATLCERERSPVPRFVQQCIRAVEARGLDIDGLYRISGNLATIQKLRYKVSADERLDLEDGRWEDVHVITGALKLFFRELPEPLFPFSHFRHSIRSPRFPSPELQDQAQRSRLVRSLVHTLPAPNHDTMRLLFQHLCRVIEYGEQNRMSVQSVAIVFGPTLLRPETEEASMPMTMVFQNQVVELILQQCSDIFPPH